LPSDRPALCGCGGAAEPRRRGGRGAPFWALSNGRYSGFPKEVNVSFTAWPWACCRQSRNRPLRADHRSASASGSSGASGRTSCLFIP